MSAASYSSVMKVLKLELKRQDLSYEELGRRIGVPHATLKKWFVAEDGALGRIEDVCRALGLTLGEVFRRIEESGVRTVRMSDAQQSYFSENRVALHVYWLLVYERRPLAELPSLLRLEPAEIRKILLRLDRLDLIRVAENDRVVVPSARPVRWGPEGKFMNAIYKDWSEGILREALAAPGEGELVLQYFQLSEASAAAFAKDLRELEEKYARLTTAEISARRATKKLRALFAVREGSFLKSGRGP